jgi:glycosyltransferase involved in cell wall biosynthesis
LLDGYNYRLLPSAKGKEIGKALGSPNWDLIAEVVRSKYDVIWINSYVGSNALVARTAAYFFGIPVFFRDDTNLLTPRPLWKRIAKDLVLRTFLRGTWAYYVGAENKRYWESYGVPPRRLIFAPHCVDNDFWLSKARELVPLREAIRRSFGITDDSSVILFCGKFIPKKQPLLLLSAFTKIRGRRPCWLLMVGDGELRHDIEQQILQSEVPGVILTGFLNQDELPRAYTAADVFALPSAHHETWGLVVNEAMNFGLPVVASDRVGCSRDLVKNDWNGFTFAHDNEDALTDALTMLLDSADRRRTFGSNGIKLIADYSVRACAEGIIQGARAACGRTS